MKIAYILTSLANSGPIVVAYELVRLMVSHGNEVDVFYFDDKVDLNFPCSVYKISMESHFNFNNYDLIHCHGLRPDLFVMLHKPMFSKVPVCTTIHSYMFSDHKYKYGKYLSQITARLVLASTMRDDKIILLSKDMLNYYSNYLPMHKLAYVYNTRSCSSDDSLDDEEREELLAFKGAASIMLCSVSGLNRRKGLHQIIEVLPLLPQFKYCIVGDGVERKNLEKLAVELGVKDRCLFVGSKRAGFRYLKFADIFVMPSYSEGFPLAMLEAASMGKAIVCSDIPIFKEIFSDDEIVRFKLDNVENLKSALQFAYKERNSFETNVYAKYIKEYSPECFYNKHIEIYKQLLK